MVDIYSLISRAQKLREETRLDSVSPDRVGALCEDTLKYINEYQLLASSPSLNKIYASVSAMQSDPAPKSDLTGKALKSGQLAVIVPASQTDATAGDVYRYDGPSGNTSAWTFVSKIGAVPADAELNATSANPVQNKVVTEKLTELSEKIDNLPKGAFLTPVTHAELVNLRDNGSLVAGSFYRITDYITTTVQENTQSAEHPFDVIVLALSENTLAEEAYAIQSARDTDGYFANSNLSAWKLWYCLDNDATRFVWADEENGKGVIYRMIDEWNNDVPYDFKNIQYEDKQGFTYTQWGKMSVFLRSEGLDKMIAGVQYYGYVADDAPIAWSEGKCWITDAEPTTTSALYNEDGSAISYGGSIISVSLEYRKYYTFAEADDLKGGCYCNEIKPYLKEGVQNLNKICFGNGCNSNTFGNDCCYNSFGNDCYYNSFGYACHSNTFGNACYSNTFGNDCDSNTFGNDCDYNSFGYACHSNSFGYACYSNTFGSFCYANSFGNDCESNSFGNNCHSNSFGNGCDSNTFGSFCYANSFGNDCYYNKFCGTTSAYEGYYYRFNHLGDGVRDCVFMNGATASSSQCVQNYDVAQGVNNISIGVTRNLAYETKVALSTSGALKVFNLADLA